MPIAFSCPNCGKKFSAAESLAGKERTCPKCGSTMTVPDFSQPKFKAQIDRVKLSVSREQDAPASEEPLLLGMRAKHPEDLVDITAMVDIVFFLLIFFLVTSMQSLESVINMPAPQAPSAASASVRQVPDYDNDPSYVSVTIEDDDSIWVEDEQVFSEQDLRAKLRAARNKDDQLTGLFVHGAAEASHGTFVMVLDAGAGAGLKDLMFSVAGQTDSPDEG